MMRKISFRAWDKEKQRWVKPSDLDDANQCAVRPTDGGFRFLNEDESSFMFSQFTGLFDRTGREIYEGDVVKVHDEAVDDEEHDYTQVVEWVKDGGYFCREEAGDVCPPLGEEDVVLEVIGNVWENPELLKVETNQDKAA